MNDPTKLPQPNIPLLRKAVEWAEAEAAKTDGTGLWNQDAFAYTTECGTAFCIAGYAVMNGVPGASLDNPGVLWPGLKVDGRPRDWFPVGQEVLGLTESEADWLFEPENSIQTVRAIAEEIAARAGERL